MKKLIISGIAGALLVFSSQNALEAYCPPESTVQSEQGVSTCMVSIEDSFAQGETKSEEHYLEKGKNYLFSAGGCPRVGALGIYLLDKNGKVVKKNTGGKPSLCYQANQSGDYTIQVKVLSLVGSNTWGNMNACFSEGC